MSDNEIEYIWNPETGILDFETNPEELSSTETQSIRSVWQDQRDRLKGTRQLEEFHQRLQREWAIETGAIENLYEISRGVTLTLIEHGLNVDLIRRGDTDKPKDLVIEMIKAQQDTLEGIFTFVSNQRPLSTSYIKELHSALVRHQHTADGIDANNNRVEIPLIKGDWKKFPNSPVKDNVEYFYCPPEQVASEMDKLVKMHITHIDNGVSPEVEAAWLHHRFTQIHPFQDGNGRVARALASLVLVKAKLFPLVVTRDDDAVYKKALEIADNGDLSVLIDLFVKLQRVQFRKATAVSENILSDRANVESILDDLLKAATRKADKKQSNLEKVFKYSSQLERIIEERLEELTGEITSILQRLTSNAGSWVTRSNEETAHWFRSQIIQVSEREKLEYYANFRDYRSWVALNLSWERRARLVFTFHGIGFDFNGSLVCAPLLEFRDLEVDEGEDTQVKSSVIDVAEEAFVFYYNEPFEATERRFTDWAENVIAIALKQLVQNF